ncbi:hypothetical protein PDIG_02220 [Penicillium digitatum PHI26]|uniref:Uncharacterized protein n=2 Tax=Penicillium digitatum TaxID=36651 RepID=K9GY50_PEND2|nr:hypothetical protein PDIP_13530 [Penicillium digitatum Pd1]EKV19583.1 hypothetical protein PDIG_02220 [Penicillium digitatum PHI26]EKV20733.1 hypothetical protein PDIP_13530 [Penicillium digitatum Pd1]
MPKRPFGYRCSDLLFPSFKSLFNPPRLILASNRIVLCHKIWCHRLFMIFHRHWSSIPIDRLHRSQAFLFDYSKLCIFSIWHSQIFAYLTACRSTR